MYQTLRKKHREKHLHQAGAVKHPGITCSASRVISEHQLVTDLEIKIFFWMNSGNCCSYKSHEARWHFWRWILQGHRAKHQQKGMSVAGVKILPVTPLPCSWPTILTTWRIFFFSRHKSPPKTNRHGIIFDEKPEQQLFSEEMHYILSSRKLLQLHLLIVELE